MSRARDYRDLVIEQLSNDVAALTEERRADRELSRAALDVLHAKDIENARLRDQLAALRDELRRYVRAAVTGRKAA